jgi:peptide/nickel transport system permease protein
MRSKWLGPAIILFFFIMAVGAEQFAPYGRYEQVGPSFEPPSSLYILGTDDCGYDIFSQVIWGSRNSFLIGIMTSIFAVSGGLIWGILAGYYGGLTDRLLMRLCDIILSLPQLMFMILIAVYVGPSLSNIIIMLAVFMMPRIARVIRGQVISLKENAYIKTSRMFGAKARYLVRRHYIPELFPLICISVVNLVGRAILAESGLAFLGLGDPTSKSWGLIINYALSYPMTYLTNAWTWWILAPVACIILLNLGFVMVGYSLEEVFDPRLRSRDSKVAGKAKIKYQNGDESYENHKKTTNSNSTGGGYF